MQAMLTRWGFTTVWDLGSDPPNSLPLRRRVYADEVLGPTFCLSAAFSPKTASAYLPDALKLPRPRRRTSGAMARYYLRIGLDGIKLFTGSYKGEDKPVANMDAAVAKAAVDVAHAAGQAGVRASAKHGRYRGRDRRRRRRDGAHGRQASRAIRPSSSRASSSRALR